MDPKESKLKRVIKAVIANNRLMRPGSKITRLIETIAPGNSMDPKESKLKQVIKTVIANNRSLRPEPKLIRLIETITANNRLHPESKLIQLMETVAANNRSLHPGAKLRRPITMVVANNRSMHTDSEKESRFRRLIKTVIANNRSMHPAFKFRRLIKTIVSTKSESNLLSIITRLMSLNNSTDLDPDLDSKVVSHIVQIISFVSLMDLDSMAESKLKSLVTQAISVFNSMDLESQPEPQSKLITLISQKISVLKSIDSNSEFKTFVAETSSLTQKPDSDSNLISLLSQTWSLEPEPELISLIHQIFSLVIPMISMKFISLSPQAKLRSENGIFHVDEVPLGSNIKWQCLPLNWTKYKGHYATHFFCRGCNGENHGEYEKAPVEIKHPLHQKHCLQLVMLSHKKETRECYCCDKDLKGVFYYCSSCDYAMNVACVEKPRLLSIDESKWHEHPLALFPRKTSLTCDLCALPDSSCPFYICPPCDFVVHQSCISLPQIIKISRHPHRISFTPSFRQGNWSCGVCRKKINNDYGGYSCIKDDCLYAAHSRCATQSNVWDGKDLEGEPEEIEEEVLEPFVRISDGIIQHFSHQHHHLRLGVNTDRDYDENKICQACVMPISYGNFYSCLKCDYILHEECANLSRKIHHPIHPHLLTLVDGYECYGQRCSTCPWYCGAGYFYICSLNDCDFQLHVQCATISEPLVHGSHVHPLFLTSKPGERKKCFVCKDSRLECTNETFNCIECDFALCFGCATLPEKMRYKHDKHILTLCYGEEASTRAYWCEACEGEVNPRERFYKCDEYCCVTLHIECLIGKDLYMQPGVELLYGSNTIYVFPNIPRMSRPFCFDCNKRCPHKTVFLAYGRLFCSTSCVVR